MRIKIADLVTKASLLIGETPTWSVDAEECEGATLADRLSLEIELRATEALLATPREQITGWKPLDGSALIAQEDGSVMLPLPDDFLLLHSVRLNGWERSVTEMHLPESATAKLQSAKWAPLRASAQRPVAILKPADEGNTLHLYGAHSDPASLREGYYLPRPRIDDDGYVELPEASIPILLSRINC